MRIPALVVCIFLVGCAGDAVTRAKVALGISCQSYAGVLSSLTPMVTNRRLSDSNIARVQNINKIVKPVCEKDSTFDPFAGIKAVELAIDSLKAIKEGGT